ncbi:MmgE/PrpD family protein [Variovorax saccharolyticus]|uniref:MmgE/PrpD family protein n=1 Tax=Variovorax saccharolyticus TaxID=3053516 RepID=UPI002577F19E|nr:MmgE/PrpD family protein [Variovorax sp. J31P216]MDM0026663.1 MmgE/PrpD family protein [Variovorax sp. J31P216]
MNTSNTSSQVGNIASALADFAAGLTASEVPEPVWTKSVHHIVDGIGLAFASHQFPFAAPGLAGIAAAAGVGEGTVIGSNRRLAPRDAAMANGFLMHGLDFDDTHPASIVHPTVACLPAALAVGEATGTNWGELVAAYVAGMETCIRLGQSVNGGFHHAGFHATGLLSHFSAAVVAGKLLGLRAEQLVDAQGIAASTASGVQVFLENGAWTKRMHPGWGALAGITAAHMVQHGFAAPQRPYEGRFGFFETHMQAHANEVDMASIAEGLGSRWTILDTAIKPYPVCHFIHGCAEAALQLHALIRDPSQVQAIRCELPAATIPIVAEPAAAKKLPRSDYEAKFSTPFVVAACLLRGRFGLAELNDESLRDPSILAMAQRVECVEEQGSQFPKYFSGAVTVRLASGEVLTRRVPVNLGSGERALSREDIVAKFRGTAGIGLEDARVARVLDLLLSATPSTPVRTIAAALRG